MTRSFSIQRSTTWSMACDGSMTRPLAMRRVVMMRIVSSGVGGGPVEAAAPGGVEWHGLSGGGSCYGPNPRRVDRGTAPVDLAGAVSPVHHRAEIGQAHQGRGFGGGRVRREQCRCDLTGWDS